VLDLVLVVLPLAEEAAIPVMMMTPALELARVLGVVRAQVQAVVLDLERDLGLTPVQVLALVRVLVEQGPVLELVRVLELVPALELVQVQVQELVRQRRPSVQRQPLPMMMISASQHRCPVSMVPHGRLVLMLRSSFAALLPMLFSELNFHSFFFFCVGSGQKNNLVQDHYTILFFCRSRFMCSMDIHVVLPFLLSYPLCCYLRFLHGSLWK